MHFAALLMRLQIAISFLSLDLTDLSPLNGESIDRLFISFGHRLRDV
jgi:hypothetical protein